MWLFLACFLSIYTAMHAAVFVRVRVLFHNRVSPWICFPLFAFLILAPVLCRILERAGLEGPARSVAMVGYPWMGFLFLAFWMTLCSWVLEGAFHAVEHFAGMPAPFWNSKTAAWIVVGGAGLLSIYGTWEAQNLKVEGFRLETRKLPPETDRLVIVQISDLHAGLLTRKAEVQKVVRKVQALQPDLLVSTGDLLDSASPSVEKLLLAFRKLNPPLGKVAVLGNHEYYAGRRAAVRLLEKAGFRVLCDEVLMINDFFRIVGLDEGTSRRSQRALRILRSFPDGPFTLVLKHRPDILPEILGRFDLQLSGHTHRGQIFPFGLLVRLPYPHLSGTYPLAHGSRLHVSRGTGTWGPPMRIGAPPEITTIQVTKKKTPSSEML